MSKGRFDLAARLSARLAHLGQDYCIFTCGGRDFAASVVAAREVLPGEEATPVPQAPPALVGVLNLRGQVLPLVQLDSLLDMPARPYAADDQILVLSAADVDIGLVVDRVRDVRTIDDTEIQPHPSGTPAQHLFRGCWASPMGVVTVLDAEKVVNEAVRTVSVRFQQRVSGRDAQASRTAAAVSVE